jgi:type I restriction enzyme S subunit
VHEFEHLLVREHDLILGMDRPIVAAGLKLGRAPFVELCLRDGRFERFLAHDGMTGTDLPHITGDGVATFPIPMPPMNEQREIMRRVDQLLALADVLDDRIDVAAARIGRSSQAVLAKAFRGELAPG